MRVLFLTHRLPYAPNRGDRLRAYHILRTLAQHAAVDLVSLVHDRDEASHEHDLDHIAASVAVAPVPWLRTRLHAVAHLARHEPLTLALLNSPGVSRAVASVAARHPPDVVLAYCSSMAQFALDPPLRDVPLVLDMVDADSAKWSSLSHDAAGLKRWIYAREGRTLAAFEARAMTHAAATICVNEKEQRILVGLAPHARVDVVENGVSLDAFARPNDIVVTPAHAVFCGVMNYPPNEAAAIWLATEIWPRVRTALPHAHLTLVGAFPTARVMRLASEPLGIEVTGAVEDVRPYLWRSGVAVAPLLTARGVQNKVLEAIAASLPCIVTPQVMDGLPADVRPACTVAADAQAFADEMIRGMRLSADELTRRAHTADLTGLSWPRRLAPLVRLMHELGGQSTD